MADLQLNWNSQKLFTTICLSNNKSVMHLQVSVLRGISTVSKQNVLTQH